MQAIEKTDVHGAAAEYAALNRGIARPAAAESQNVQNVLYTRRGSLLHGAAGAADPTEGFDRYY